MLGDQIEKAIRLLQYEPNTRRCVIAMWEPAYDLGKDSLDIPCNTHIYFKIRNDNLNMMVCNRSNDVIWGALGANAVHFSFLQEYIAANLEVGVGTYTHVSDCFHIYTDNPVWKLHKSVGTASYSRFYQEDATAMPLVQEPLTFDMNLTNFMKDDWHEYRYDEPFFVSVAVPMRQTWDIYKRDQGRANWPTIAMTLEKVLSRDWYLAATQWMKKRYKR